MHIGLRDNTHLNIHTLTHSLILSHTHTHTLTRSLTPHVQAEEMASIYVPFCQSKTASEELLASHRSYLNVSLSASELWAALEGYYLACYTSSLPPSLPPSSGPHPYYCISLFSLSPCRLHHWAESAESVWHGGSSLLPDDKAGPADHQVPSAAEGGLASFPRNSRLLK